MNYKLTVQVKDYAYRLGADLVGVANIGRFANAPVMMSPQGILPTAKSVVVCAIHHPDACIELGGEPEPQDIGPYKIQYAMNNKLDVISFKLARTLDDLGYKTIPIASSNIWRYREYKSLKAVFSPDISHIYAAVAAGLGEMGWNGLALTPEYGARNRFVSVITEAELEPTPLYDGPKLCDMCGECIKNCPTDAYRKEVAGVNRLNIEGKEYRFANKNLWRCAWGEHFDLDLNLDIPDVVNEQVIIDKVKAHGMRGGEFGVCLRVCLPSFLRYKDPSYTRVHRRKRHFLPSNTPLHRGVVDKVMAIACKNQIDHVSFIGNEKLLEHGINVKTCLPDGSSVIFLGTCFRLPKENGMPESKYNELLASYKSIARYNLDFSVLDIARELEMLGYSAVVKTNLDHGKLLEICRDSTASGEDCEHWFYDHIAVSCNLPEKNFKTGYGAGAGSEAISAGNMSASALAGYIKKICLDAGADMAGIAPAARIDSLVGQLRRVKEGERRLRATDRNTRFMAYDPVVEETFRHLQVPSDYVKNAVSVIVIGLHFPEGVVERAKKPPAEAVGPYVFAQYETERLLGHIGYSVVKTLNDMGYAAVYTYDLMNMGAQTGSPRGYLKSSVNNALEAVAAGLGQLAFNGNLYTGLYGINQRFVAIVTDAVIEPDTVQANCEAISFCRECGKCIKVCPVKALAVEKTISVELDGKAIQYLPPDTLRCEWSCKYALCGEDGFQYIGSDLNEIPGDKIRAEDLAEALKKIDPIIKYRPVTAECCIVDCPLANGVII